MSLFLSIREQLAGRGPAHVRGVPPWAQCSLTITAGELVQLRELNTLSGDQSNLLKQIMAAWERGDLASLNRWLQDCAAYFDPNKPHLLVYFVGLGGIDLFVTLLCDVGFPALLKKQAAQKSVPSNTTTQASWQLVKAITLIMRVLTELLVCHNELGWYYYDHYPGLFFQLLEFAKVPDMRLTALVMLEHLFLSVGPVLEISKVPVLQELIRTDNDATLAILCRVIALLIVPGVVLNQRESPHQRLLFPESLLPLQRIQRVIDSNVLWLIGEKDLVKRLVKLCEVRGSNDDLGLHRIDRATAFSGMPMTQPFLDEWATTAVAAPLEPGGSILPNTLFGGLDFGPMALSATRAMSRGNVNDTTTRNDWRGARGYTQGLSGDDIVETVLDRALGTFAESWAFEDGTSAASVAAVGSNVDFSWFVGCTDAKQRWRLRDLTLREEVDDNRPLLCGFGPVTNKRACEAFRQQCRDFAHFLNSESRVSTVSHSPQVIVGAQSEILFVLNLMLSTFFLGDVWCTLRDCHWMEAAKRFYDAAFDPSAADHSLSPYLEQLQQATELRQLPRFLSPHESGGAANEGMEVSEHGGPNNNSNSNDDAYDSYNSESEHRKERLLLAAHSGEDTEAYIRHSAHHGVSDDDDIFDDKDHQHEPNTIRKLELLRGVQEFWNAQGRHECAMLHEGDTPEKSAPLAMKIAMTLVERTEDSCVETSACHALEGYLRCFSFPLKVKGVPGSAQTVVGKVLMQSILEHRVYNATYVPGVSGSLSPSKRIDSFFALLGELIRYHHGNLTLLQDYVVGSVSLCHLNNPAATTSSHVRQIHIASEHMEQLLRMPPLDREEHEPFAKVLLRRISRHGCDTNLFVRSLILSLTPGLRSTMNYVWRPVTPSTVDAKESLDSVARIGDVVTGHPNRLNYIARNSRRFVTLLSERLRGTERSLREEEGVTAEAASSADPEQDPSSSASTLTMWDVLQILLRSPHRSPLGERPFPCLFNDYDRAIVMGEIELPPIGPPSHLVVPLFPEFTDTDDGGLGTLAGLEKALLQEPHRLVYSMLGPLNAERIQNAGRLCVVTTCVLVFVRAARMGGASAVHDILRKLKPLATVNYEKWKKQRDAPVQCAKRRNRRSRGSGNRSGHPAGESSCFCTANDGTSRCSAFLLHGHCAPLSSSEQYYHRYGGCFFRNMFRLMCVWVGHYGACQRYVETLFYCTEVPFAESKCVVLYLMRVLPDYFL
ncbi:hypothetical protein DQ04_03961050 [Trypanosoma grayi]|uniref:hypothetical protein n=1 Tax=Trypanosoma grayi TaxID=71804 RepID=UPI0004F44883|nr:hypothetical protein DQ04_03961050 [Trypanosoma grayi]KEG10266.1 hypothetical protein DQ04_03961050 [Trypanosoma grayi]